MTYTSNKSINHAPESELPNLPALEGLRVLILEDEYLIAMDVEQLCRDHGAVDVRIIARLDELPAGDLPEDFDVAIVDLKLDGESTLSFAELLKAAWQTLRVRHRLHRQSGSDGRVSRRAGDRQAIFGIRRGRCGCTGLWPQGPDRLIRPRSIP